MSTPRSSRGIITHRHADPGKGGRIVEHPDRTFGCGWVDEARGGRGYLMVAADGRGAVAFAPVGKDAVRKCCEQLGLDASRYLGGAR